MGRTGRKNAKHGVSVVGATPMSDKAPFTDFGQQLRQQAAVDDAYVVVATKQNKPAKITVVNFFTAPPRTEVLVEGHGDNIKRIKQRDGAAANLGHISAAIWAKTAASKGGAKDSTAGASARLQHIIKEMAELSENDGRTTLMCAEGFRAYANDTLWGVRAPGEADDAPFDELDPLQVRDRLKELWKVWRKLPASTQHMWADKQLAQEAAAALQRANGSSKAPKVRRVAASLSTAERSTKSSSKSKKKPDGWSYCPPPVKASDRSKAAAAELEELRRVEHDEAAASDKENDEHAAQGEPQRQHRRKGKQTKQKIKGQKGDVWEQDYKRAAALKHSRLALMAEMRSWEDEEEMHETAARLGMSVDELRHRRAQHAAAGQHANEHKKDQQNRPGAEEHEAINKASSNKKRKHCAGKKASKAIAVDAEDDEDAAADNASIKKRKCNKATSLHKARKLAAAAALREEDAASSDGESDEDVVDAKEMAHTLSDEDNSDADVSSGPASMHTDNDDEDWEEQPEVHPANKHAAAAIGAAALQSNSPQRKSKTARKQVAGSAEVYKVKKAAGSSKKRHATEQPASNSIDDMAGAALLIAAAADIKHTSSKPGSNKRCKHEQSSKSEAGAAGDVAGVAAGAAAAEQKAVHKSPKRKSKHTGKDTKDDNAAAASGAGPSSPDPVVRRGRSATAAGAKKEAHIDRLEKTIFSNTRRSSYGRPDSPGVAAAAAAFASKRSSKLGKNRS